MAITRTAPYGTVTDDSGGGTDGTIANNAWLQGLLDLLDARWSRTTTTSTGTQTVINPSEADLLICNNASDLTIRSITAPASPAKPSKKLVIIAKGAGNVYLNHQDTTGTTAANRLVNFATSGATPIAAGVGAAVYIYDDNASRWQLTAHEQGDYITPTYASGNYTAGGSMTWTVDSGDVTTNKYYLSGRRLHWLLHLATTTVGGTANPELRAAVPGGYTQVATSAAQWMRYTNNSATFVSTPGLAFPQNTAYLSFYLDGVGTTNWTLSTNQTNIQGAFALAVT